MPPVLVRPGVRAVVGAALCSAGLLTAAPLSPAVAATDPQRLVEQAPVVSTDVSVRPQGVPVRSTAATGTPPQIAYSVTQRNAAGTTATAVVRLNPLTAQARTVVASRGRLLFADAWSDDRARIYYDAVDVPLEGDVVTGSVDSVPQAGGTPRRERSNALGLDVSRNGNRLVYVRQEGNTSNVFVSDAAGRNERRVTGAGGFGPRLSPDGTRIVFSRLPNTLQGSADVFVVRTDGTGLTRVTGRRDTDDVAGAFSPDGRRLLFTRAEQDANIDVFSVGVDGRGLRLVRASAGNPDWASNGWISYLTFDTRNAQVAVRAPGASGAETVLTRERSSVTEARFVA